MANGFFYFNKIRLNIKTLYKQSAQESNQSSPVFHHLLLPNQNLFGEAQGQNQKTGRFAHLLICCIDHQEIQARCSESIDAKHQPG